MSKCGFWLPQGYLWKCSIPLSWNNSNNYTFLFETCAYVCPNIIKTQINQLSTFMTFIINKLSSSIDFLHISTWITFIFSSLYSDFQNFLSCFNYKRFLASNRYFDLLNAKVSQVQLLLFLTNQIWDRPKKIYITFINKLDHI